MGGQNESSIELSVAHLNVCTVLHVKPEKNLGGQEATKGGRMPPAPPPPKCNPYKVTTQLFVTRVVLNTVWPKIWTENLIWWIGEWTSIPPN